ncbi:hypothetical protein AB0F81_35785 [Actinoplanes sp. NPDC024001]|uniref:hypothetical protein n=1 Tax=Actinoplanes sp. NPDC024001 TaxID=3154598 RepID=UPI0033F7FB9B
MSTDDGMGVVIIGEHDDAHVTAVESAVRRRGVGCLVLDERYAYVRIRYEGGSPRVEALDRDSWRDLGTACSVWWWRKETTLVHSHGNDFAGDFAMREHRELLESLEFLLPGPRWPIRPSALRRSSLKCRQLALAKRLGFTVPLTVVTNHAASVAGFVEAHRTAMSEQAVLYKPLTWYVTPSGGFLFANLVTVDEIRNAEASVSSAPCQFQQYVNKDHEVRVTVVGDRWFATRIESQAHPETRTDHRRAPGLNHYAPTSLPTAVSQRIKRFLRETGLAYGAFDLAVDAEGVHYFLELNPVGQWLWLEQRTGAGITAAVADLLCEPAAQ